MHRAIVNNHNKTTNMQKTVIETYIQSMRCYQEDPDCTQELKDEYDTVIRHLQGLLRPEIDQIKEAYQDGRNDASNSDGIHHLIISPQNTGNMEQNNESIKQKMKKCIEDHTFTSTSGLSVCGIDDAANCCADFAQNEAIEFAEFNTQFIPTLNSNDGKIVWFNKQENTMLTTADLYTLFKQQKP